MQIYITGISFKTADISIREKFSFSKEEQKLLIEKITNEKDIKEAVILSTCNRTEVYVYSDLGNYDSSIVENILCNMNNLSLYEMKKYFYVYSGIDTVSHIFKVASGLDSQILGEDQILCQVKGAFNTALEMKTSLSKLNTLFRHAITAAKKIKNETTLSQNTISIGTLVYKSINNIFKNNLEEKTLLIIGTGDLGQLILKNLQNKNLKKIYITNRTHLKIDKLENKNKNIIGIDYSNRYLYINEADIIISATSSPHYTITRNDFDKNIINNKSRVLIDLSVPRDIDIDICKTENIIYYNIDGYKITAKKNIELKNIEAKKAELIIDELIKNYKKWYDFHNLLSILNKWKEDES